MKQCVSPDTYKRCSSVDSFFVQQSSLATGSEFSCDPPAAKITRRQSELSIQPRLRFPPSRCCFVRVNMKEKEQYVYLPLEETDVTPLVVSYSLEKTAMWLQPRVTPEEQECVLESLKRDFRELGLSNASPLAGTGASAIVLKTVYGGRDVAVKVFRQGVTGKYFSNEMSVLSQIGTHPNLIGIYGFCPSPSALIMEFSEMGSLFDLLHNERDLLTRQTVFGDSAPENRTTAERCAETETVIAHYGSLQNAIIMHREQLALDIARGMAYLHSRHCVHLDLTSRNILITSDFRAKITDFGLSVMTIEGELAERQLGHAPSYWKAPELGHRAQPSLLPSPAPTPTLLVSVAESPSVGSPAAPGQNAPLSSEVSTPSPPSTPAPPLSPSSAGSLAAQLKRPRRLFTPKVDVFSYGLVLWELFHPGKFPWDGDLHPDARMRHGERPTISATVPPAWQMLIVACWQQNAAHRPSSNDVKCWLERNMSALKSH